MNIKVLNKSLRSGRARRHFARLGLLAGLVLGPAAMARDWIKLEAPDFVVMSDARESVVREFAIEFAGFREATRQMFARPGVRTPRSIIILHSSHKDFVAYGAREDGDSRSRPFSFSTEVDGRAVTALARGSNWEETRRMMAEFETLWLLRRYGWSLPTWMAQGSGSVVSTASVDDDGTVEVGATLFHERVWRDGAMLGWKRFFEVGRNSPEYRGDKAPGVFHAQAWGLMHWLLLRDEDGRKRFAELARRVSQQPFAEAVVAVSGYELDEFDHKIRAHLRGRLPVRRFAFDGAAVEQAFTVSPLAEAELLALQSDVAAAVGKSAEADLRYLRAVSLAPDAPTTLESGARWMKRRGEFAGAIDKYRAAIAAGSENPAAYLASAEWRLERSTGRLDRIGGGVPLVVETAEAEVRQALELDPASGEAYQLLGRLAVLEKEPDAGKLELLAKRVGPDFWGIQARYYRALLLHRLEREDEAVADLQWIISQPEVSETTRANAESRLADIRLAPLIEQVTTATKESAYEEALALIDNWEKAEGGPSVAGALRAMRERIGDAKAQYEQRELDRAMDRLNRMLKVRAFAEAQAAARALLKREVSATLQAAFKRVSAQVDEIATMQLMRAANKEGRWADAVRLGEEYLPGAPDESKYREAIEEALAEAKANLP